MTVHSTQLAAAPAAGAGDTLLYTAPAGTRVIVKSVVLLNGHNASQRCYVKGVVGGTAQWFLPAILAASGSAGELAVLAPWIVINAGDELVVNAASSSVAVVISGAVLGL